MLMLLVLLSVSTTSHAQNTGEELYQHLVDRGAIIDYQLNLISNIARDLAGENVRINSPYDPTKINIYIVNTRQLLPQELKAYGLPDIDRALAQEATKTVLINSDHVRELVAIAFLYWERRWSMARSVAALKVEGIDSARQLWDPSVNSRLRSDEIENWRIALRGALAFLIAHEMGHVAITVQEPLYTRTPVVLNSARAEDIAWMCPQLIDEKFVHLRKSEQLADEYAVRLLRTRGDRGTYNRYEVGAEWYLTYLLEDSFIKGIIHTKTLENNTRLLNLFTSRYGSELLQRILALHSSRATGPIVAFYPNTHPDVLSRLFQSFGVDQEMRQLINEWSLRIERECGALTR